MTTRHPDDKWDPEDYKAVGENHEQNNVRLFELGISLTLAANGQIVSIKHRVSRGVSETLYKWNGPQPQLPKQRTTH